MSDQIATEDSSGSPDANDPNEATDQVLQFNLSLLFSLITLAAFAAAIIAPFLRDAEDVSFIRVAFIASIQLAGMGVYVSAAAKRRAAMLRTSGKRLGTGYCGVLRWRHWPFIKSWMITLLVSLFQFVLAVIFSSAPIHIGMIMYWFYLFQLGVQSGMVFSNMFWKIYPSSITFYENGLINPMNSYFTWDKVTVRPSTLYPDRFVVVFHPDPKGMGADTKVVQAPKALRARVFLAATERANVVSQEPSVGR